MKPADKRSAARKSEDRALEEEVVAYEYERLYQQGVRGLQDAIAKELKMSQPKVSQLLQGARERNRLQVRFVPSGDTAEAREFRRDQIVYRIQKAKNDLKFDPDRLRADLVALAGQNGVPPVRRIRFVDSGAAVTREPAHTSRLKEFAAEAVEHIKDLFRVTKVMGVGWGPLLGHLVEQMEMKTPDPLRGKNDPVSFFPLCGELAKHKHELLSKSASVLASRLNGVINREHTLMLTYFPACLSIPSISGKAGKATAKVRAEEAAELELARKLFLSENPCYQEIFFGYKDQQKSRYAPLIEQVDSVLTSIGDVSSLGRSDWRTERLEAAGLSEGDLKTHCLGDICGVYIQSPSQERGGQETKEALAHINNTWTGIQREHLERCARAASDTRPGVIALAVGEAKAAVVRRCIELGLINVLIMDIDLAKKLAAQVAPVKPSSDW